MQDPVVVAGGGIGGLAAALALARKGRAVVVLEQASQFGEIGAGIQMAPNAFRVFDYLGLGDAARHGAVLVDELILMDALKDGRITTIPVGEPFRRRFGNPYAVVHRADLHGALLDACRAHGKIELHVRSKVERYEQDGSAVTVRLASGETLRGSGLVGADGLRSAVREQVVGDGPPVVSGHTTYRSVIPTEKMPEELRWNAATLWAGPKVHLVHYPLKGGKVFNLVVTCHDDAAEPVTGLSVEKDQVRPFFAHVCERARSIIEHGEDWKLWVLCDREPVQNWVDGRVALLGDAAHPMLQYFAQGACQALEDAMCLAEALDARPNDFAAALTLYNRVRAPQTGRVQMGSRLIGDYIFHPAGARADVRNAVMTALTPDDWYRSLKWLFDRDWMDGLNQ